MRLEKASYKAIKYACLNFHYAKSIPVNTFGYSVFKVLTFKKCVYTFIIQQKVIK